LKIAQLSLGIAIGSTWSGLFKGWTPLLFLLFLTSEGYVGYVWLKQQRATIAFMFVNSQFFRTEAGRKK
jgi:hypothetical protein